MLTRRYLRRILTLLVVLLQNWKCTSTYLVLVSRGGYAWHVVNVYITDLYWRVNSQVCGRSCLAIRLTFVNAQTLVLFQLFQLVDQQVYRGLIVLAIHI